MKKLSRSILVVLIGFSLSSPAAFACEIPENGFFAWVYHIVHPEPDVRDRDDHHRGNGGRDCPGGGKSSGTASGSTSGGSTTPPTSPKS